MGNSPDNTSLSENFVSAIQVETLLKEVSTVNARRTNRTKENLFDREIQKVESFLDEKALPVLHVVNYKGGGFLIMPADNRANPVLAFSETNAFPISDSYPSGLMDWLAYSKEYIQSIRSTGEKQTATAMGSLCYGGASSAARR